MKRIAGFCYEKRKLVVVAWLVLLVGLGALGALVGGDFRSDFSLPGSESQEALDLLTDAGFVDRGGEQGQIVFRAENGVHDPAVRETMEAMFEDIGNNVENVVILSPYDPAGARQISPDGTIAYAEISFLDDLQEEISAASEAILEHRPAEQEGLTVEFGGAYFASFSEPSSEMIGLIAAVIILLIAFGSVLAMGLPIGTALFGIGCGISLVMLSTRFLKVPDFSTATAAMVGIGVGIDYALFIVTRYREGLARGLSTRDAVVMAMNTAGRAVLFAGGTVVISVLGLLLLNLSSMSGVAVAISLGVLMTMLASLTLLPALLGLVGKHIDRFGLPHRAQRHDNPRASIWVRWSQVIQRRPVASLLVALVVMVALMVPVADLRLGFGDTGNRPETDTSRRAYDLLAEGFGVGSNGPLVLAIDLPGRAIDSETLDRLAGAVQTTDGVTYAGEPIVSEDGQTAVMMVVPDSSPQDAATQDLIHTLRDDVIPEATASSGVRVLVGSSTAAAIDFAEYTLNKMPIFFGAVLALSFVLLMVVFRSLLVPLKAVVMNLLSIGAAYGVLVAVYQWGWGLSLLGGGKEGPIEAWVPIMLFAVVFGLSMDYEVFLLSRIREEYDRTGDNGQSVADGLALTARVITAAAAIMVCVFGSFVFSAERELQMVGFGLATAILVDATIVRLVLVPATMELLGDRNWWLPGWLDRILPHVQIESAPAPRRTEPVRTPGGN